MSTDDPFDDELRARLASTDAERPDAPARLEELRPRFRAARRRRQQRVAALSSAAAIVLVLVGVAVLGGGDDQAIDIANDSHPSTTVSTVPSTTTSTQLTTTTAVASATTTAPTAPNGVSTTTAVPSPGGTTVPVRPPATVPTAPVTTTVAPGGTQVLHSEGGTATVTWTATSIRVDSNAPAAGWVHEATEQKSPTRVEVRFRRTDGGSGSSTAKIDARVIDGSLTVDN